jgi:murein DD-endopeptidase MepM/ murein hydrolase activator NlpD
MAFVMIATGATSRSRVRTLSVRPLAAAIALAAAGLLAAGAALGYWLAAPIGARTAPLAAVERAPVSEPFTLEQIGAISARLFRLENEAAQLGRRIGALSKEAPPPVTRPPRRPEELSGAAPTGASGGPLLAPLPEPSASRSALDAQLSRVEQEIASVADATAQRSIELMRLPTRLPIEGAELTSTFGNRTDPFNHVSAFHAGLDFAAAYGTPIVAAAGGTVAFAGFKRDFGWVVEIDHGNGLLTRYAHASQLLVHAGQIVAPGDRIAMVGSTGRSTGPHLHFEVQRGGGPIDPRRYLAGL